MNVARMFTLAKNVSKLSSHRFKMGAVLVKNGTPISVGYNQVKSNPRAPICGLHAEAQAIRSSGKDSVPGGIMFVYREMQPKSRNPQKIPALAKPCPHCMKELQEFGIKKVYYTTNEYPYFDMMKI